MCATIKVPGVNVGRHWGTSIAFSHISQNENCRNKRIINGKIIEAKILSEDNATKKLRACITG